MDLNIKNQIETNLNLLKQETLSDIGRSGSMLWLGFGNKVEVQSRYGSSVLKSYYTMDVKCSWRLIKGSKIILASRDIFEPKVGISIDDFDWEVYGTSRFDEQLIKFKNNLNFDFKVSDITADILGGFRMCFNLGYEFEVFPDDSLREEYWRFIIFDNPSKHFVVFDK